MRRVEDSGLKTQGSRLDTRGSEGARERGRSNPAGRLYTLPRLLVPSPARLFCVLCLSFGIALHCHASVLEPTDKLPKLISGKNLLAIGVYQDSLGSSDSTLIVKLVADGEILVDKGSPVKYIEPKKDIPSEKNPIGWAMPGFDDSHWKEGVFGVGYGDNDDNTIVGSQATTLSIYTRAYFNVRDASKIKTLTLNIDYDDSVLVWLNGVEIARSLPTELPETPHWDDQCGERNTHEASKKDPPLYESVKLELTRKKGDKAPSKKEAKRSPLDQLASEIQGAIVYSRNRHIYIVVIGDWKPIDLGRGEYARWSPDGKKIAVYDRRKIFVMDMDGSNRKLVTDEAWGEHGGPIEFHPNCREIIFIRRNKRGLWAADISNGRMRKLADSRSYTPDRIGELGISADGKRMVCRLNRDLYAIDLVKKTDHVYAKSACSSGISPDGRWLMNNRGEHKSMDIRNWDGKRVRVLRSSIGRWDNQTWSNHKDYICAEGEETGDSYVIKVSANRATRVTWVGSTVYPDLYVMNTEHKTQDSRRKTQDIRHETSDMRQEIEDGGSEVSGLRSQVLSLESSLSLESWILGLALGVAVTENPSNPAVVLVNKDYNRLTSRVLIRRILRPTRANLDYAAYDSNVMHYDPTMFEPNPPPAQALSDLHFDKTLVPESLTDRLSETPLTPVEKAAPMAWLPVTEYLMDWDFDLGYALAEAGWKISEDTWNDHKVSSDYQEVSRVYIHTNRDGTHGLWVRVEFKPWVKFLKNVDDEDGDGFPEIYGMIDGQFFNEKLIQRMLNDYTRRVLSADEVTDWTHSLGTDWYDKYNTRTLESEQIKVWPNAQTEPEVKTELGGLVLEQPDIVIRGQPFGKPIYNIFDF
jgi:hypothetical protein